MGDEVNAASTSARTRPDSSTAKNRDAVKKIAALWKKQTKGFKLKDVGKKVDAVRFCTQDERFFREQPEVLPLLMGFLSRTKVRTLNRNSKIPLKSSESTNWLSAGTLRRPPNSSWKH